MLKVKIEKKSLFYMIIMGILIFESIHFIDVCKENIEKIKSNSDIDYGRYVIINYSLFDAYTGIEIEPVVFSTITKGENVYVYGLSGYTLINKKDNFSKAKKTKENFYKEFPYLVKAIYYNKASFIEKLFSVQYVNTIEGLDEHIKVKLEIAGTTHKKGFYNKICKIDRSALMNEKRFSLEKKIINK